MRKFRNHLSLALLLAALAQQSQMSVVGNSLEQAIESAKVNPPPTLTPTIKHTPLPSFTPTPTPTDILPTTTPEVALSEQIKSLNAQYVTYEKLSIDRAYVNGYSLQASDTPNLFTQFSLACRPYFFDEVENIFVPYDVPQSCIGLLVHNYFVQGKAIEENAQIGDEVLVQNDKKQILRYRVEKILRYQAVPPLGSGQMLINLDGIQEPLTVDEIMEYIYGEQGKNGLNMGNNFLIIQTCIWYDSNGNGQKDKDGDNWLWGRMFVIGELVDVNEPED